jgi:hypothetical protein
MQKYRIRLPIIGGGRPEMDPTLGNEFYRKMPMPKINWWLILISA